MKWEIQVVFAVTIKSSWGGYRKIYRNVLLFYGMSVHKNWKSEHYCVIHLWHACRVSAISANLCSLSSLTSCSSLSRPWSCYCATPQLNLVTCVRMHACMFACACVHTNTHTQKNVLQNAMQFFFLSAQKRGLELPRDFDQTFLHFPRHCWSEGTGKCLCTVSNLILVSCHLHRVTSW